MQTYRIIGTDQKEYGPVNSDQIRAWIAQGRINAATRMRMEEGGEWKTLADFPEFSRDPGSRVPPVPRSLPSEPVAGAKTSGMAIASLVLGILSPLTCSLSALVGVILGPVAMNGIQKSNGQLRGKGIALAGTIVSGVFLLMIPIFAAMLLPALARAKGRAQTIRCANNMNILAATARMYASRNGKLPPAQTWCDALKSDVHSDQIFECPVSHNGQRSNYAFNAKLDGMDVNQVAPNTVMLFETEGGWNLSGGPELMLQSPRHVRNEYVVAFADGSVREVTRSELGTLRWDPARDQ